MEPGVVIRALVAGMLAAGTHTVAACGGDDATGHAALTAERERREAALNYARCMREHGVDVPDPTFESGGPVGQAGPDEDTPPDTLRQADRACETYKPEFEPPALSEDEQQEFNDAARANSRCMREHGIENFPDPTIDEEGRAEVMIKEDSGIDPNDPDFREAEEACKDTMPKPPSEGSAP